MPIMYAHYQYIAIYTHCTHSHAKIKSRQSSPPKAPLPFPKNHKLLCLPLFRSSIRAMRVPVTNSQTNNNNNNNNNSQNPKPENNPGLIFHRTPPRNLCYEPTSVLDLRHSPSPVAADSNKPASKISDVVLTTHPNNNQHEPLEWDEQAYNLDWDTIMRDLGLHDDSVPNLKTTNQPNTTDVPQIHHHLPEYPHPQPFDPTQLVHSDFSLSDVYSSHNFNLTSSYDHHHNDTHHQSSFNSNVGFDFIEELIRAADCFDSDELNLAQVILDRLSQRQRLSSPGSKPVGKPLQRAAVYFKDALWSLLNNSTAGSSPVRNLSSWSEIVQTIRAYKSFSGISPIPMFSHFTTNQALLEALSSSSFIHVIDFDIGLGGQYASLMKELAEKADVSRRSPPLLRITAVVPEEYAVESRLVRENLSQFAQELKIRFQIDFLLVRTFEILSFKAIKFIEGEKTAVLLSPYIIRRLSSADNVGAFLADIRLVSPCVVVFVDVEGLAESGASSSFRRNFVSGLEYFSIMLESLDAAVPGGDMVRKIETFLLRPKIEAAVEAAGRRVLPWREVFHGAGMRAVELSQFADFQAQCLLGKVQVRGFHVAKKQAELVLCWHDRALVATSAWRC